MAGEYINLAQVISVQNMLLGEKKWLEWVLSYIAQERNSLQIEVFELSNRLIKCKKHDNSLTQNGQPSNSDEAIAMKTSMDIMQNVAETNKIQQEKLQNPRVTFPPYEEVDNVEELNLSTNNALVDEMDEQHSLEEEEDEDYEMDFFLDMNMLMNG